MEDRQPRLLRGKDTERIGIQKRQKPRHRMAGLLRDRHLSGAGVADGRWRLWNTFNDRKKAESDDIGPFLKKANLPGTGPEVPVFCHRLPEKDAPAGNRSGFP